MSQASSFGISNSTMLLSIVTLLTPNVVETLPPYFHNINTTNDANRWFSNMKSDSHLFGLILKGTTTPIGFVFLSKSSNNKTHIGYLLGDTFWRKGYASEVLLAFIIQCRENRLVKMLVGGVDQDNISSAKLLSKLGFTKSHTQTDGVCFYQLVLY